MEKVINLLAEIEEKANRIIDRSSLEKNVLYDQLTKDIKSFDKELANDTLKKIVELQDNMFSEISQEKQALLDDCEKQSYDLDNYFNDNHEALVNEVFQNIIKL